jgi:RES domain-containing protein
MPLVWRLVRPEFADKLDGEGSRVAGGRWNSRGRRALYASEHLSLGVLEVYVHLAPEMRDNLPVLAAVQISIPDNVGTARITRERLAQLLTKPDPLAACQAVGDDWLGRGDDLVLQVPSILVPEEDNSILNPAHPDMRNVAIIATRTFRFDPRLVVERQA